MTIPERLPLPPEPIAAYKIGSSPYEARDELSLQGVLGFLRRRRRLILVLAAAVAVTLAAALRMQPALYEATALVLIDPREQRVLDPEQSLSSVALNSAYVDSEVEAMNARDLAVRLVEAADLRSDPEFNPAAATEAATSAAGRPDRTPDRVAAALEARRRGNTNVIEVTFAASSPEKAAQLANAAVEAYISGAIALDRAGAERADHWLQQRLAELRRQVNEREAAADAFRARAGLIAAQGSTLPEQRITQVQAAVLDARRALAEAQARHGQVQGLIARGGSPEAVAAAVNNALIRDLRGREADIARQQAELSTRYGARHPEVQNIRAERADIAGRIQLELQRIAASLASEVEVAQAQLSSLEGELRSVQGSVLEANGRMAQLRQLEREAEAARAVYQSFLERSHEITEQGGLNATRARLLSPATPPGGDNAPSLGLVLLASSILGLLAGFVAALLVEQIDDRLMGADDVEQKLGFPAVASIPIVPKNALEALPFDQRHPARFLIEKPLSAFAESLRVLRAAIVYGVGMERPRILAITSALPGEGKTTVALSLARIAAMSGERVALIDCDVRRRAINDVLDIAPERGLLEVLAGETNWRDVMGRDEDTTAHILPLSDAAIPLHDLIGSSAMRDLTQELAREYDLVLLDCGPVLAVAETRGLVALADAVVVVGRWRKTSARTLGNALAQIRATGAIIGGVVLNAVDPNAPGRISHSDSLYYVDARRAYYHA